MWDRDMKKSRYIFGRIRKSTGNIYFPVSQYREAGGHLNLSSFLYDNVIKSALWIGKYINKHELYRQFPPRRLKNTNNNKIESFSWVINVMIVTPVLNIEIEQCVACSFLLKS